MIFYKVSRVVNMYGPQTRYPSQSEDPARTDARRGDAVMDSLEERLANMEQHLNLAGLTSCYSHLHFCSLI